MHGYRSYAVAAWICRTLPLGFSYWIGLRAADWFFRRDHEGREAVCANLRRILAARGIAPARGSVEALARKTYQYFGKYLVDFFYYSGVTPHGVERRVSIERLDYLESARALNRGVILATAHVGNWELGGLMLSLMGYEVTAVYRPMGIRNLDRMFQAQREGRGLRLVPLGRAAREMLSTLRRKGIVALLADRDFGENLAQHKVNFFGAPACLPMGAAFMSFRTGAPIVPGFLLREVDDRFRMRFYPPIDPQACGDVETIQRRLVDTMEQVIGEYPHQWYLFEDFWKTAADGCKGAPDERRN